MPIVGFENERPAIVRACKLIERLVLDWCVHCLFHAAADGRRQSAKCDGARVEKLLHLRVIKRQAPVRVNFAAGMECPSLLEKETQSESTTHRIYATIWQLDGSIRDVAITVFENERTAAADQKTKTAGPL